MDSVDLVVTACTTAENVDLCIEAARRGKHIVSVKPFAMSLADADRLIQAVCETGVLFASFDASYRLNGQWQQYKQWIGEGRIGTPVSATLIQRANLEGASMDWPGRRHDRTWWRDPSKVPGGGWIDHAIYQVDGLRWLLDDEVARVSGVAKTLSHPELPKELEDFGVALLEFRNGLVATVEVTWTGTPGGGMTLTQIVGTEGQIASDPTLSGKLAVSGPKFESPARGGWTLFNPQARRGTRGLAEHLLECLDTGRRPVATIDDSRATLATCLAFYEAARTGQAVSL
jgi:predicted dehydrogenase